jgi:hypothetical protein
MVHQGCGLDDPGISAFRPRITTFLRAINRAFFLSFADEHDAFALLESFTLLFGKVVFALSLCKSNQSNSVVLGKALDRVHELASDRLHHAGGSHLVPAVDSYELQRTLDGLELGHIDVEIHPVDALHF